MDLLRRFHMILALAFPVAIFTPLALSFVAPPQEVSQVERRRLAPAPAVAFWNINEFPAQFEAWYNDHFGLRSPLIRIYNYLNVAGLGLGSTKGVIVGKKGWLFQGGDPHVREMRNAWPFHEHELQRWATVLQAKHDWLAQRQIAYYFVVTPNKERIYPEYLPDSIVMVSDTSRARQLIDYLRANTTVNVIDLRPDLEQAKPLQRSYHRTDTHWNDFGAYIGYRAMLKKFEPLFPELTILSLAKDDFHMVTQPGGDLAQNLDLADVLPEENITPREPVTRCARNPTLGPDADHDTLFENEFATYCDDARYRALMFRDSFSLAMMPYLSESFAYIYYFPHSPASMKGIRVMTAQHRPDIVIEQRAGRWLRTPEG